MENDLHLRNIRYSVQDGAGVRRVLDIPELFLPGGTLAGIYGDSGSGKTSLLSLLCGLVLPDSCQGCELRWGEDDLLAMPEGRRDAWRGRHVGMIFQDFQLFPQLSAMENVLLPATFRSFSISEDLRDRARDLLKRLGIRRTDVSAGVFSRGEQQRRRNDVQHDGSKLAGAVQPVFAAAHHTYFRLTGLQLRCRLAGME